MIYFTVISFKIDRFHSLIKNFTMKSKLEMNTLFVCFDEK